MDPNRTPIRALNCRELTIEIGRRTLIMGILNITPNSFSDGGRYVTTETAVARALRMVEEGADLIDVGGESTRPGAEPVSLEEELHRAIPIITALKAVLRVPISVDTYKAETARQAMEAGAQIINDVWGFKADPEMAKVAAEFQCPVILSHNRKESQYRNLVQEVIEDLYESIEIAHKAGVAEENIILDPGIGFGKTIQHNLILMNHLKDIVSMGYPVLLGTSRKSFIRHTLNLPAEDVVEGTAVTVAFGIAQGCEIIRV
ncbi:MAG TPA: dihydropteroate synthase, partial [Bacilli bacterium]